MTEKETLPPFCVDLDGTIIATDLFIESIVRLIVRNPLRIFSLLFWLVRGRAFAKRKVAELCPGEVDTLPYREEVLTLIREKREKGHRIVLATASHRILAQRVADHLQLFDEVIATEGDKNLKGSSKANRLISRFGEKGYEYIGDAKADVPVWKSASTAYVVGSQSLTSQITTPVHVITPVVVQSWRALFRALRVVQWVKNTLVFVPLFASHKIFASGELSPFLLVDALLAWGAFSFIASGVYLINDISDLAADRAHPRKRARPFASGALSVACGALLAPLLFLTGGYIGSLFSPAFLFVLGTYLLITTLYTVWLKKLVIADVIVLAVLYTIRVVGGAVALDIVLTPWLIALTMFLFFSLACVKRIAELAEAAHHTKNKGEVSGRGYRSGDAQGVAQACSASACCSVLVLVLYVNDTTVSSSYSHPERLWCVAPFLLYWTLRLLILAQRGEIREDPVVFALRDRVSYFVLAAAALCVGMAM